MEVAPQGQNTRILYVITKGTWGGAQRYVHDLAVAAHTAGHAVTVAYGEPGELARRLTAAGVRTLQVPSLARDVSFGSDLSALASLTRLFRKERPDVVHLNSSKAGAVGALAARLARVPRIVFTAHGWAFNENRPAWQRAVFALMHAATVLLAHVTLCVSEAVRRDMNWLPGAGNKLRVIHLGVTCPDFIDRSAARAQLLPNHATGTWIGMLSELHPTKRVDDAIDAFAAIAHDHPDAVLVVMGEGSERQALEQRVRTGGLEGRVHLLGFVEDAPRYLLAVDLFLHTSRSEALGYAVLEAGCAGLPVVATRVGGIPEIIIDGESGVLVPRFSPTRVAAAMRELLADQARRRAFGIALRGRVATRFGTETMIANTLDAYRA